MTVMFLRPGSSMVRWRLLVAVGALVLLAAGCADDETPTAGDDPPTTADGSDAGGEPDEDQPADGEDGTGPDEDTAAFCAEAAELEEERPAGYVGSAEHVEDIDALAAASPDAIRPDVETLSAFLADGGVDPADPATNLRENYPPEILTSIDAITDFISATC